MADSRWGEGVTAVTGALGLPPGRSVDELCAGSQHGSSEHEVFVRRREAPGERGVPGARCPPGSRAKRPHEADVTAGSRGHQRRAHSSLTRTTSPRDRGPLGSRCISLCTSVAAPLAPTRLPSPPTAGRQALAPCPPGRAHAKLKEGTGRRDGLRTGRSEWAAMAS